MYKYFWKPLIDISVALFLLIILLPFFVLVAILIKLDSQGPIFFNQERVGKDLVLFSVWKFRTMTNEKRDVGDQPIIGKANGVTRFGYLLRRYKIDELPQLYNVLKGHLSLVGPRPSVKEQLVNMTKQELQRYSIKPGLTGLAQVSGNIHVNWKERYKRDLKYVNNISFVTDIKIFMRTIFVIIYGEAYFVDKPLKLSK